ncbi:hypothetical protein M9H77_25276 [Catharanthus roseus]|uniref:Uncharacterized protein n=1 Tax=Catharanthus roseus TaxID=4058 RepID=A0ACC0AAM8_CATRO|nr:hypothetical protein M9H77_25276 [Catharanthus roseus]
MDHSGQQRLAQAEAPSEALPSNCRPNFGAAWLTKDKFKVNETYACWYTMGISTVNMYQDGLFNCQAKDPSNVEMLRRYFILSMRMLKSFFSNGTSSLVHWRWDAVVGLITGFSTSLLSFGIFLLYGLAGDTICEKAWSYQDLQSQLWLQPYEYGSYKQQKDLLEYCSCGLNVAALVSHTIKLQFWKSAIGP